MTTSTSSPNAVESDLRRELSEKIDRGELDLPVLSDVATKIASMCLEASADARQLADTLNHDPALAGHVLRVANSSNYAPVEPIISLQQAISRLGFSTLGQIAFAIAIGSRVFHVPGHDAWVGEMWRHSTLTAGWAREVARVRRHNGESAFLCGLLHDVGMPVLLQTAVDVLRKANTRADRELLEPIVHELHGAAGARLAQAWKMPAWIGAAMLHHHESHTVRDHAIEVQTTQLADELAHWTSERPDETPEELIEHLHRLPILETLSLYDDELETLLSRRDKVLDFAGALQ
ncbi:MAG: HDOD domain-containing protein [Planctomycetes bacterium]|nr:HDOD domain-containing protein [Planctomycetota bacterium]